MNGQTKMTNLLLVDTDILIDVANGIPNAINRLKSESESLFLAISVITKMELVVGCRNKTELQHLHKFLQNYELIFIDEFIFNKAVELIVDYRLRGCLRSYFLYNLVLDSAPLAPQVWGESDSKSPILGGFRGL